MAFFRNNTVNLLNLHYGIHSIALTGGGAFFLVYLLRAGVPAPAVLLALAAILFGRFIVRPLVVPLGARLGIKPLVVAGTLLTACQYPLIAEVHGVGPALFAMIVVGAVADSVYWSSYHAFFAALGDHEHRGQQIAIREAVAALIGIVSPIAAGWALVAFGPRVAFGASALVIALAAVPLLFTPNVTVPRHSPGAFRTARLGMLLFVSDGWSVGGYYFAWQILLFISLGQSFLAYGGALAVAAVAGAIGGLLLGRHIDMGNGRRAVFLAFGGFFAVTILRATAGGHPALAVFANAVGSLESCLYIPTLMTAVYNQAKRSPCTLRFHVMSEGGWDVGGAGCCVLIALLISSGVPLALCVLTSLAGGALSFWVLRRYYAENSVSDDEAAAVPLAVEPPVSLP